jgi:hypothetical protein
VCGRDDGFDEAYEVQRVRLRGTIEHRGKLIFLTKLLRGEPVGSLPAAADVGRDPKSDEALKSKDLPTKLLPLRPV